MRRLLLHILIGNIAIAMLSCRQTTDDGQSEQRVLLVYMAVDEAAVSSDWYEKREAIVEGAAGTDGEILIYSDPDRSAPCLERVIIGGNGTPQLKTVEEYDEENSASPEVLRRVVERTRRLFPDRRYGLIVFTHSSGWMPAGTLIDPMATRSIGIDDNPGGRQSVRKEMELADFSNAIPDGMFDFIIFESCLTANVEVAYELRRKAHYVVASAAEIASPGFTPIYRKQIPLLKDVSKTPDKILAGFAASYLTEAKANKKYDNSATISVSATSPMDELAAVVRNIVMKPAAQIGSIDEIQHFDRYGIYRHPSYPRYFDLAEYTARIASVEQLGQFESVMRRVVTYSGSTPAFLLNYKGFIINRHCGLTTYIERPEYEQGRINAAWRATSWARAIK